MPRGPHTPRIRKGIYYFPTFQAAHAFARDYRFPTNRIIPYQIGWAIQKYISGPYVGPTDYVQRMRQAMKATARGINPSFRYVYRPGVLDRFDPTMIKGRPIPPNTLVRVLAKRPAGGKTIQGWGRTFAWIADIHGNEQIVFRRALEKTSSRGY
jgi:hypothetical protein